MNPTWVNLLLLIVWSSVGRPRVKQVVGMTVRPEQLKTNLMLMLIFALKIWYNPLLRWNKTHYGGIKTINVSPKKVWKPDLYLYNK